MLYSVLHTTHFSPPAVIPLRSRIFTLTFRRHVDEDASPRHSSPVERFQWEMECILPCVSCSKCRGEIETKGESPTILSPGDN